MAAMRKLLMPIPRRTPTPSVGCDQREPRTSVSDAISANGGGKDGKGKGQGQKGDGGKSGGKGGKDAKPSADKGKGKGPDRLQLCVHIIYSKCHAKECFYRHAHPETPEEKEHYKALYKTISSRSRSQSPAPSKTSVCRYWRASNCPHGKDCKFAHSNPAAPSNTRLEVR